MCPFQPLFQPFGIHLSSFFSLPRRIGTTVTHHQALQFFLPSSFAPPPFHRAVRTPLPLNDPRKQSPYPSFPLFASNLLSLSNSGKLFRPPLPLSSFFDRGQKMQKFLSSRCRLLFSRFVTLSMGVGGWTQELLPFPSGHSPPPEVMKIERTGLAAFSFLIEFERTGR